MSSLDKMLGILDLFDQDRAGVRLDDVVTSTQASRATAYRYLQSLTDAGLLAPATGGTYVLGPRIIELDRLVRRTDPLLTHAAKPLRELSATLGANVMLCSYYGDKVMCVDLDWPDTSVTRFYERGRPMPMFRGAMAKTILANLSPYHLRNIMEWHAADIREAGLGEDWEEFRGHMARLRKAGIVVTQGEVVADLVGMGAPIFDPELRVLGSLVLAVPQRRFEAADAEVLAARLTATTARINASIASLSGGESGRPTASARPRRSRRPKE